MYAYFVLFCFLLPVRAGFIALSGLILLWLLLSTINEHEIALTQLPLTSLDIRIALSNPRGFLNAVGAAPWVGYVILVSAITVSTIPLRLLVRTVSRWRYVVTSHTWRSTTVHSLVFVLFFTLVSRTTVTYTNAIAAQIDTADLWAPWGVTRLSQKLGRLGFLVLSYELERIDNADYHDLRLGKALKPGELWNAIDKYVNLKNNKPHKYPNIVILLAESTFDPHLAFRLSRPARNSLFERGAQTQALRPMFVNAIGGGTWISEFESITGLDSRLIGYMGYYTHSSLAPHVRESFPRYLKRRGYSTAAYYPISGTFYNARKAYGYYGFDRFFDSKTLGLSGKWSVSDERVIEAVIETANSADESPFFKYILTVANHAPHNCDYFSDIARQTVQFESAERIDPRNCVLNEYIHLTHSTSRAFSKLVSHLREIERTTGRPFVALLFGDHQPHTFTRGSFDNNFDNFDLFRTRLTKRHIIFHVVSSIPNVIKLDADVAPHVTLIPTLLSAYVASAPDDLYLGVNWYQPAFSI